MGVLLMEFFNLYGRKFNYDETCIRITGGGQYFDRDEIPNNEFIGTRTDICIENSLKKNTLDLNPPNSSLKIKPAFECAYNTLLAAMSNCKQRCILGSIVRIPDNLIEYRNLIRDKFEYVLTSSYQTFELLSKLLESQFETKECCI